MRKKGNSILLEITAAVMLIMVLSSGGCSRDRNGGVVEVDESDDGGTIRLSVGQEMTLTLESNPTTGYSWQLGALDGVLVQNGDIEYLSEAEEGVVGAGGVEVFRFSADEAGTVTLRLEYRRPWEEGTAPEKVFSVEVVVE